eukprot:g2331.t1
MEETKRIQESEENLLQWVRPPVRGDLPCPRGGNTIVPLGTTKLVSFGGHYYSAKGTFEYCNDVHLLDLSTNKWRQCKIRGQVRPLARYNHTADVVGNRMYVYGGRGAGNVLLSDIMYLDLKSWTWHNVASATHSPPARASHSSVLVDNKLVYFGGLGTSGSGQSGGGGGKQEKCLNDLWVFDTETFQWIRPRTAGKSPSPRHGHVSGLSLDGRIFIHGGADVSPSKGLKYLSDLYELDTETMVWTRPRISGAEYPSKRLNHKACMIGNYFVIFGGWTPKPVNLLPDFIQEANEKFLMGKEKKANANSCDYLYCLDTETMEWHRPEYAGAVPAKLYSYGIATLGPQVFIFGGCDGSRPLNTTVVLEFPVAE